MIDWNFIMTWWKRVFGRRQTNSLKGSMFRVVATLYSQDGNRAAEVRKFSNGETYLLESERADGAAFAERHEGRLVGPFASPELAERFIVATPWFRGDA